MIDYTIIIIWHRKYQSYMAIVPELSGMMAFGNTPEEALKEIQVSIDMFLEEEKNEENRETP